MWLQTKKGIWFLPVGSSVKGQPGSLYFLWPLKKDPDLVHLFKISDRGKHITRAGQVVATDAVPLERRVELDLGKRWAEKYAREEDPSISLKSSPWRSKGQPTDGQLKLITTRTELVHGADYRTRGDASNIISIMVAGWVGL